MPLSELKSTPIVIISRDRLEPLRELLEWLNRAGYNRPIIVDNASTYPPLVDFLEQADIEVIRLERNLGHLAPWSSEEVKATVGPHQLFVATDCDVIPDDACPTDVVEHLAEILMAFADIDKVGLGLRIDDLPECYALKDQVIAWESHFWEREIAPGIYDAEVDTTFALYRTIAVPHRTVRALRTGPPYVARHVPWYADTANPTDEQQYYREHAQSTTSHWETDEAGAHLQLLLTRRADETDRRELAAITDDPQLLAWSREPPPHDEAAYTPWAEHGWFAWDEASPEVEFCDLAAVLMRFTAPPLVVETGVGRGFLTRRLGAHLRHDQHLLTFESDSEIREKLVELPFFRASNRSIAPSPSPSDEVLSRAGLTILDSEVPVRVDELDRWVRTARPGAILLLHDGGNGHGPDSAHREIHQRIAELDVSGVRLHNPRGGFLGIKV